MLLSQGRNEIRWRPGQEARLAPPCSNPSSFGRKFTALKEVLVTCLWFFGAPEIVTSPRYAPVFPQRSWREMQVGLWTDERMGCFQSSGGIALPETYESNIFHPILYYSENSICDIRPFCRPLFSHSLVKHNIISRYSDLVMRDLTTKYHWNRPPDFTGWICSCFQCGCWQWVQEVGTRSRRGFIAASNNTYRRRLASSWSALISGRHVQAPVPLTGTCLRSCWPV